MQCEPLVGTVQAGLQALRVLHELRITIQLRMRPKYFKKLSGEPTKPTKPGLTLAASMMGKIRNGGISKIKLDESSRPSRD